MIRDSGLLFWATLYKQTHTHTHILVLTLNQKFRYLCKECPTQSWNGVCLYLQSTI